MLLTVLKYAGIVLAVLFVVFIAGAYLMPKTINVERDITIDAPPAEVFPYVNNYKKFNEWSPWANRDPDATYTYSGPEAGEGAKMSWEGSESVGAGSQTITASEENRRVETELDFGDQGTAQAYFNLEPRSDGTETNITWGMNSDMGNNPIARWMGLMMDRWVGTDYEKGLKNLKETVEKGQDS